MKAMRMLSNKKSLSGKLPIILSLAILIATIHFIPLVSLKNYSYAQGAERVALINSIPTASAAHSSPFISTDETTCALDKPNTYLQIECMNALPLLLPTFSPVPNNLRNNISDVNDTGEAITDNSTISDTGSGFVNDSSFDNSTFGSFEGGGSSSSSDSFDFSSGDISSSDGEPFSSGSDNHPPKADSQTIALNESESKAFTLTGSDKDGDALVFTNISTPTHGKLTDDSPPDLIYQPDLKHTGKDSIMFKVYDGIDFSKIATINFVVDKPSLPIINENDTATNNGTNNVPIADAGLDQTVYENQTVSLDGSKSKDKDSDQLAYRWKVLSSNSEIKLKNSDSAKPEFVAPVVDKKTDIKIQLTVDDGKGGKSNDDVIVTILKENREPAADAGSDQSVESGKKVKLDGSKSSDPDGDQLSFIWKREDGPHGKLSGENSEKPTFTAPKVDRDSEVTISLTVEDKNNSKSTDEVKLTITPATSEVNTDSLTPDNDANSKDTNSKDTSHSDSKDTNSKDTSHSDSKDASSKDTSRSDSKDASSKDTSRSDSKDSSDAGN